MNRPTKASQKGAPQRTGCEIISYSQEDLQPSINIGTIGHVAHGKSTLVKAMTGVKTAKFGKEHEKNMTIKLGYANCKIWSCSNCQHYHPTDSKKMSGQVPCPKCKTIMTLARHISFVDCPGHEILMATMLNGAAVMDASLLLIAANEPCPRPQTKEHLVASSMVGLRNYIVVQNKVDLVTQHAAEANYEEIKAFVASSPAAHAPVIPISAQQGYNVDYLCQSLANMKTPPKDLDAAPFMIVVRSFDINHPGEESISNLKGGVAGGSLLRGTLRLGQAIEVRPGRVEVCDGKFTCRPLRTTVSSLMSDQNPLQKAEPGGLIAVGTKLDPSLAKGDGLKGQVIGLPGQMPPIFSALEISYLTMKRAIGLDTSSKPVLGEKKLDDRVKSLKKGDVVRLNVGSSTVDATVTATKADLAKLTLQLPVCAPIGSKLSISKEIGQGHWRLVGVGKIHAGTEVPVITPKMRDMEDSNLT